MLNNAKQLFKLISGQKSRKLVFFTERFDKFAFCTNIQIDEKLR